MPWNRGLRSALALLACTPFLVACTHTPDSSPSSSTNASRGADLADPLDRITDPDSPDFVANQVDVVLDERGSGAAAFDIPRPDTALSGIRFYVECSPASAFQVTMGTFFSGDCAPEFQNYGQVPLSSATEPGPLHVELDLPDGVEYLVIAIAMP